jgi:protein TonB
MAATAQGLLRRGHERAGARSWLFRLAAIALLIISVVVARHYLIADNAHIRPSIQRIQLVNPPPPPARPVAEERKPVEKPKEKERVEEIEYRKGTIALVDPQQAAAAGPRREGAVGPPAGDHLGVDADAEGAGDGFGLTGRRGGREITTIGSGGGGGLGGAGGLDSRALYRSYGRTVAQRLQSELQSVPGLLHRDYVLLVSIWIDPRGRIMRTELPQSSGSRDVDTLLRTTIAENAALPDPPAGLPQPLRLRFTVSGASRSANE